jgi:hypothetical protein
MRTLSVLLATIVLAGCASDPGKVSEGDLDKVRDSSQNVQIGMSKDDALDAYPKANKVRLATSSVDGVAIEEWKIEAYHDDDWNKSRDLFVSFLYFANGTLVDISDTRIDYREDTDLVKRWAGGGG